MPGSNEVESMHQDWQPAGVRVRQAMEDAMKHAQAFAEMVDQLPVDNAVKDAARGLRAQLAHGPQLVDDLMQLCRMANAADFARGESPRPGEPKWDVGR